MFPSARDELENIGTAENFLPDLRTKNDGRRKFEIDSDSSNQNPTNGVPNSKNKDLLIVCYHRRFVGKESNFLS